MCMITPDDNIMTVPMLALRGIVLFPDATLHFDVGREKSVNALNAAMDQNRLIFLVAQRDAEVTDPGFNDIYRIGVLAEIKQVLKQPGNIMRVMVEGIYRAGIVEEVSDKDFFTASVSCIDERSSDSPKANAALRAAKQVFAEYVALVPKMPKDMLEKIANCKDAGRLADYMAANLLIDFAKKQAVLEMINPVSRLEKLIELLSEEIQIIELESTVNQKTKERIDKNQREYYLREQMRVIQEELGMDDDPEFESFEYREKIAKLNLSEEITETLMKEAAKLEKLPFGAQEGNVIRTYLDSCLELPWNKFTKEKIDIEKVKKSLDKDHYGLDKVKERILELLAVRKLSPEAHGQIICLVGPPGVGKTSIARSIGKAINRKTERIALGGIRDEAEIRGHRRTYIGAMPGRIMAAVKKAKSMNPLIILDEVDKLGNDIKGDPTSALLEVLDSEQNNSFHDHYIDLPFDLSNVMFITTANDASAIPAPLLDRMELISLASYTREEKFHIAKKHLIPKQLKNAGLTASICKLKDDAIYALIDGYVREAGVRNLERTIQVLFAKVALKLLSDNTSKFTINAADVQSYLGARKYKDESVSENDEIGVVTGLAWTSVGGEVLPVEVAVMDGTGKIELTGNLGDVMKESAHAAITCIRSNAQDFGVDADFYKNKDIHIHAPEGAVPKDGPSAGITMATAILSALSNSPVDRYTAMTGEITLRGRVLPIGGLKEKTMAAYRYGIKRVIIPADNLSDLEEVDPKVKEAIEFVPVSNFTQVADLAIKRVVTDDNMPVASIIAEKQHKSTDVMRTN
ncbi:MAG: endopeptidase La [Acutalibacteraceae bacterium]